MGTRPRFHRQPRQDRFSRAEEHARLKGKERFKIFGLLIEADGPADLGDEVWDGDKKVGVITCPSYSKLTNRSMAIMRVEVPYAVQGTKLQVKGKTVNAPAIAHTITFDDPKKTKRTAQG